MMGGRAGMRGCETANYPLASYPGHVFGGKSVDLNGRWSV